MTIQRQTNATNTQQQGNTTGQAPRTGTTPPAPAQPYTTGNDVYTYDSQHQHDSHELGHTGQQQRP